ncbi:guanine-N-1-methyltransferase [Abortiporus biennis]|nr:guanine-N-1-methyltransferase [Abortiporus biennis]
MSSNSKLDFSTPIHRITPGALVDKDAYKKTVPILALKVEPSQTGYFLKNEAMRGAILDVPRYKSVVHSPDGRRLVLTRFDDKNDFPPPTQQFLEKEKAEIVNYNIELDYDYWTAEAILHASLPEELLDGAPVGFAKVGHIAHLNLNDEYLPYKHFIGQVILDKNSSGQEGLHTGIETVVNKLDSIDNQFRVFKMEVLAGPPNFAVMHKESNCSFFFDFSKVYWNSRLHHEHERLVETFKPEDVIADVFAGVGPFALPAARKKCGIFANDLNPISFNCLNLNARLNNVTQLVRASCLDGKEFIRTVILKALQDPLPPAQAVKFNKDLRRESKQRKQAQKKNVEGSQSEQGSPSGRNRITHFVMNLPASAVEFLDAFRGILSPDNVGGRDLSGIYDKANMPMIHCYTFTRELETEKAEVDIRQRVEEQLGAPIEEDISFHLVRSVAPNKEMYCISFRLPYGLAYGA